ncbi:hypothetical protein M2137_000446 [Parabacteroides sp. PFB2-10]|uniref:DUF4924 family protein n=1 Tax=Parabacteroides sp. PFB2-10 TaxID=1742405 RepID=UPI00247307CD|nr:DUF4924 family protein [Parabacteroides sp. PFB2-10]MDH6311687.1 hypothetical protein [Parabacteroides sp. PFB2-10]MDL2245072.1 DUF4924 family protein [Parabacteroides sp. OttesenSCG-928-J18]
MIVAHQKRKENIAEYLLYMWQVEDMIRACDFDANRIRQMIISKYDQPEEVREEITRWYEELANMMLTEGVRATGHIQLNRNIILELTDLHVRLMKSPREMTYQSTYYKTLPYIVQLRAKSGGEEMPEIETCFTAVYGYLMLRMKGEETTQQTTEAVKQISTFLAILASKYRDEKSGELQLEDE